MSKHLGTYLAHYAAIVAGAAAFVAAHGTLFAVIPGATPYVAGIVGVSAALVAALHALGVNPPTSSTVKAFLPFIAVSALAVLGNTLIGCSTVSAVLNSPTGNAVVIAAVDVAVTTAEQKGVTAAQINGVAKAALAADTGVTATASAISGVLNAQLAKLNLPAGDQAAVDVLEVAFSAALAAKVGSNASVASAQAYIATLLKEVIAATGG